MKTYEDKYLRSRVNNIIQQQKTGRLLVDAYKSGVGLPTKDALGAVLTRATYPHDYQVGGYGYLDYDRDSGMYAFTAKPDSELPLALRGYKPLSLAEATVNATNRTVQIQNGETLITFTAVPVWEAMYTLLQEINEELTRQNAGVVVWKITWVNEDISNILFSGPAPRLSNAHASVTLTGYALDPDSHFLVYFGCVGYKTSIESVRATLITNKLLSMTQPGGKDQMVLPLDRYEHIWQGMPEYTCHHACFLARTALPGKWEPEDEVAYLLVFHGASDPKLEIHRQFIQRLIETLEVPVLETWADTLWNAAVQYQYVSEIESGGDCIAGAKLALKADWKGLIEKLLQENDLILE